MSASVAEFGGRVEYGGLYVKTDAGAVGSGAAVLCGTVVGAAVLGGAVSEPPHPSMRAPRRHSP